MAANKKRSTVWLYFTKNASGDTVECTLCQAKLAFSSSTGSMRNHLRWKHPNKLDGETGASTGATASGSQQTSIKDYAHALKKCDKSRSEHISNLIAEMVALDMQPVSLVEDDGFFQLMKYLEPGYEIPCRATVSSRISKLYQDCSAKIKSEIEQALYVGLTTDCWTSLNTTAYMTVTCHFLDKEWKMNAYVLATQNLEERHTGENLEKELKRVVAEWDLESDRVSACVHDNGANIVKANQACVWESVCCFAHTVQLAIQDGFKAVQILERVVGASSKLVAHFHHSTIATQALRAKQKQMLPGKEHTLIQCCKTRWNSIYNMFARLLEQRWAITAVLSDRSVTKPGDARNLELRDDYWGIIEEIEPVLKALEVATTASCAEQAVSLSDVYPVVCGLMKEHLLAANQRDGRVRTFVNTVRDSLNKRFMPLDTETASKPAVVAAVLDPRHKKLRFLSHEVRLAAKAHMEEIFEAEKEKARARHNEEEERQDEDPEPGAKKKKKETSAMAFLLGASYCADEDEQTTESELEQYFSVPTVSLEADPLVWWRAHELQYPIMARLARKFLSIPATSVSSERVFSAAGQVVSKLRSRLLPDNVNKLIFLNKNLPRPERPNKKPKTAV